MDYIHVSRDSVKRATRTLILKSNFVFIFKVDFSFSKISESCFVLFLNSS